MTPVLALEKSPSAGRVFLSLLLAGAMLAAAALSASPACHEALHHDSSVAHACLVTICASGQFSAGAAPIVWNAPSFAEIFSVASRPALFAPVVTLYFARLEHAPPVLA